MHTAHIRTDGTRQTCMEHCLETAKYAGEKLRDAGLYNTAYLAGLLHDAGKFTDEFDEYILSAHNGKPVKKGSVIHSFAGCSYIMKKFHNGMWENITAEIIAYAIGAHHGLFDIFNAVHEDGFLHRENKQPEFDSKAMSDFFTECIDEEIINELFKNAASEIEAKMTHLIEKTKENDFFESEIAFYSGLLARLILSAVIDGDRKDTFCFMSECGKTPHFNVNWEKYRDNTDAYVLSKACNTPIQKARRELSDICVDFADEPSGIYELKLPTGAGKTLSGLRYALYHAIKAEKKRIFYIAPLISIIEQNAKDIKKAVGDADIVLEHHSNVITEDDNYDPAYKDNTKLLTQTWDSPIVVTTLVQFLNTLFGGKTSQIRRFASLCDSILILDEVQSVPWNMLSMFNMAMNFLSEVCNTTILLCSATQPTFDKLEHKMFISDKSFLTEEQEKYYSDVFKRSEICYAGNFRLEQLPEFIEGISANSKSTLVICNKKSESEYLYEALKSEKYKMLHLSASMCMKHREEMTEEMKDALENGQKVLCISTQVIEAGVDVSFESVIRFKAGLDSIVQANGRCNRHGEGGENCKTYIVDCTDESLKYLKEIKKAKTAATDLLYRYNEDSGKFDNDLGSSAAVKCYYDCLFKKAVYEENYFDYPLKDMPSLLNQLSENTKWRKGEKYFLNQAFKTAGKIFEPIEGNTVSVLVPYGDGKDIINALCSDKVKYDINEAKKLIEKAKKYTVSMIYRQAESFYKDKMIYKIYNESIYVLNEEYYSSETGVRIRKEEKECSILIL